MTRKLPADIPSPEERGAVRPDMAGAQTIRIEVRIKHPDLPEYATSVVDLDTLLADRTGIFRHAAAAAQQAVNLVDAALPDRKEPTDDAD